MSFLARLKQARIARVVVVYLGASWVVIEAADLLQEQLELPEWVVPVTLILLLVGLVVVGATAWVQAQPSTEQAEAAGEVPTDWELDLGDLARSLRRGRLPHLTWGRALTGGVVAFLALFGLASLLVPGGGGEVPELTGPAAPAVAVLPFRVSGADLADWREGLVDLLSRNLDGLGELRAIDSRTVLARWDEVVDEAANPDLATALAVADRTGARWALVGSAVEVGPRVRVSADLYEVDTGRRVDGAAAEGVPDSLFALVDALTVNVARALVEREDPDLSALRLSSITTSSPEALRRFLEGEAAYRRSAFREAAESYAEAVALDSAFALAWYRLSSARGWAGTGGDDPARRRAYDHRGRLPAREALMVEAYYRTRSGALPSGVELLRQGVRRYPDDPELAYQLGDAYVHFGPQLLVDTEEAERLVARAVELDPGFAPYHIHVVDYALIRGDSARAAERLEAEAAVAGPDSRALRAHRLMFDYFYGPPTARRRVLAALDTVPRDVRRWLLTHFTLDGDKAGEAIALARAGCADRMGEPDLSAGYQYDCFYAHAAGGRINDVRRFMDILSQQGSGMPAAVGIILRQTGLDPDAPVADPDRFDGLVQTEGAYDPGVFIVGILAVERDRPALADSMARRIERMADQQTEQGDTARARVTRGLAEGIRGFQALADRRQEDALRRLERSADMLAGGIGPEATIRNIVVWPLAELYAMRGREREALPLFESLWDALHASPALARRAEIHDRLGNANRARELWARFLDLWTNADADHPLLQQAQSALEPG